jgi:predicted nucleic acid-binding protein
MVTHPNRAHPETTACNEWLEGLIAGGMEIIIPEIADYELRRELLRIEGTESLLRLDALARELTYLPLTTETMRIAARLWAEARKERRQTADDRALDADVILAAQALVKDRHDLVVATTNVGHLSRYVAASDWRQIAPPDG